MNPFHIFRLFCLVTALNLISIGATFAELDNPLVGRWVVQKIGNIDPKKMPFQIEWEFTEDKVIVRNITDGQELTRNRYTIDVTKDPKWITITVVDIAKEVRPGIFRIVGDKLHIKQEFDGGERPKDFPENGYSIYKRQK